MIKSKNNRFFAQLGITVKRKTWYEPARRAFWADPNRLMAVKAIFAIALLAIPFMLAGKPVFAVTLALGALAGALSETDDHPKGRIKSLTLKVFSFGISSLAVQLLYNYPIFLGIGLALSTVGFLLIGVLRTGVSLLDIPAVPADNFPAVVGVTIVLAVILNNWFRSRA